MSVNLAALVAPVFNSLEENEQVGLLLAQDRAVDCTVYDAETGLIRWNVAPILSQIPDQLLGITGCKLWLGYCSQATTYFVDGQPVERPKLWTMLEYTIKADGIDKVNIPLLPGVLITYEWANLDRTLKVDRWRKTYVMDDDDTESAIVFSNVVPGVYTFYLDPPPPLPYQRQVLTVTVTADA